METFFDYYSNIFRNNNLDSFISQDMSDIFERFSHILSKENKKYNLTAIKEEALILPLHFADSLLAAEFIPENSSVIDIGCGAGFPSLPLAIAINNLKITSLDSTQKKTDFIKKAAKELNTNNITTLTARAEDATQSAEYREKFDVACARAVSRLNILAELCIPFVKLGGYFIAMKGAMGEEEYKEAEKGIELLGGKLEAFYEKQLYVSESETQKRTFIIIKKISETPKTYPRMYSKIIKKPL